MGGAVKMFQLYKTMSAKPQTLTQPWSETDLALLEGWLASLTIDLASLDQKLLGYRYTDFFQPSKYRDTDTETETKIFVVNCRDQD